MRMTSIPRLGALAAVLLSTNSVAQHLAAPDPLQDLERARDGGPPQLRVWLPDANGGARVEVDLEGEDAGAILLVSDQDLMYAQTGIVPPILATTTMLPMRRSTPRTLVTEWNVDLLPAGSSACIQVIAMAGDRLRPSAVARVDAGSALALGRYEGPPVRVETYAITRIPPSLSSYAVSLTATVPSNHWQLRHHLTVRHQRGTDVYVTLVEPVPGQGTGEVVEVHQLTVDIGAANPGAIRVLVARTDNPWPVASALVFAILGL